MFIYVFPSFTIIWRLLQKIQEKCRKTIINSSTLDNKIVVYKDNGTCNLTTYNHFQLISQTSWNQRETSTLSETSIVGNINVEPVSFTTSISPDAQAIISTAWSEATKTKYNSIFKRWRNFCSEGSINSLQPNTV